MPLRRTLAIAGIIAVVVVFVGIGVVAALTAGRILTPHSPTPTPAPSATATPAG